MNVFSFPLFLTVWGLFSAILLLLLKRDEAFAERNKRLFLLGLAVLAVLFPAYSKLALGTDFVFYSSDESGLKGNYETFESSGNIWFSHSSGPAFILLIKTISEASGLGLDLIIGIIGAIIAVLTVAAIAVFIMKATKNSRLAMGGAACALYSSYLIWPIIEVRPQQIGFVFFLVISSLLFLAFMRDNNRALALSAILIVWSPMLHIMSHLFVLPVIVLTMLCTVLSKKRIGARGFLRFCTIVAAWFGGLIFSFLFVSSTFDFHFIAKRLLFLVIPLDNYNPLVVVHNPIVSIPELKFSYLLFIPAVFGMLALLAVFLVLIRYRKNLAGKTKVLLEKAERSDGRRLFKVLLFAGLLSLAVQIALHWADLGEWYYHPLLFVVLELGNLLLGVLAVYGFSKNIPNTGSEWFQRILLPAAGLAVIFAANLVLGFFMIKGFENLSIRAMNYLVAFLGFFAFVGLLSLEKNKMKAATLAILLLFPAAFAAGTREPGAIRNNITYLPNSEDPPLFEAQALVGDKNILITFLNTVRNTDENYSKEDQIISTWMWKVFRR